MMKRVEKNDAYKMIALAVVLSIPGIVRPTGAPIYVGSQMTKR
jgi:hypothetical protein